MTKKRNDSNQQLQSQDPQSHDPQSQHESHLQSQQPLEPFESLLLNKHIHKQHRQKSSKAQQLYHAVDRSL